MKVSAPIYATRCIACDGPINGDYLRPVVRKSELCGRCESAAWRAESEERRERKAAAKKRHQSDVKEPPVDPAST